MKAKFLSVSVQRVRQCTLLSSSLLQDSKENRRPVGVKDRACPRHLHLSLDKPLRIMTETQCSKSPMWPSHHEVR